MTEKKKQFLPPKIQKRAIFPASEEIASTRSSKFADMPFEELEVGQSFAVGKDEGFTDKALRSYVSLKGNKLGRKFKVKSHIDTGVYEISRMPDDFEFKQIARKRKVVEPKPVSPSFPFPNGATTGFSQETTQEPQQQVAQEPPSFRSGPRWGD